MNVDPVRASSAPLFFEQDEVGARRRRNGIKEKIRRALEDATALDDRLRRIKAELGSFEGEQLTEASTEQQLDRWTEERGLGESIDAAVKHMSAVLEELRWVEGELVK